MRKEVVGIDIHRRKEEQVFLSTRHKTCPRE
jgi:hypothetical protein